MKTVSNIIARLASVVGATAILAVMDYSALIGRQSEATAENKPTVEYVLQRYIEAIGGREAIEKLSTRACTGKKITDLTSRQQPIYESLYFEAYTRAPLSYYAETWSDQGILRTGFDGTTGWVSDRCGVHADENTMRTQLAFLLNVRGPLCVEIYFPGLSYAGTDTINGMEVHVLKPASLKPEYFTLYFSAESGLLVGIGYYWLIEGYRAVDGVLFPHRISTSRKGGSTVYEFKNVRHNVDVADSLFVMPADPR